MNRLITGIGCGLLAMASVGTVEVSAQPPEKGEGRGGSFGGGGAGGGMMTPEMMRRMNLLLATLDADSDGQISAQEINDAPSALRKLDGDADGSITMKEIMPQGGFRGMRDGQDPRRGPSDGSGGAAKGMADGAAQLKQMFAMADKDGDGKISEEEAPPMLKPRFAQVDADSNGFLSPQEIGESMKKFRERMGSGGQRPGGEQPGGDRPRRPPAE
jgi:EF hand